MSEFDVARLAGSLATVAIASLGGPVPMAGAALTEVVKAARAGYQAGAETRQLRQQVSESVHGWAKGERLDPDVVKSGLTQATWTMASVGLDYDDLANLKLDPEKAANEVVRRAQDRDRFWDREVEAHYAVAERGITATYRVLIAQLRAKEPVLLPAILAVRTQVDEYFARAEVAARSRQETLDQLKAALIAGAAVSEVREYLKARIGDWDRSVWHPDKQHPSTLERRLKARKTGRNAASAADAVLSADEALAGQRMLVVLGGPGSGKTWLARRYARQAAQAALQQLEDGAGLDEVELPLFTTWDQWTKIQGLATRESLVAASFASGLGHSDPGAADTVARLQRTFMQADVEVLMVVDSLDEAADRQVGPAADRLHELTSIPNWRVVVTSRPAAWDATSRNPAEPAERLLVVALQDLTYPDDVEPFVQAWFAAEPGRGQALVDQIREREQLVATAVSPLMLTFYCLLTETAADPSAPLPARRRKLYRSLVRRLLAGRWQANQPGLDAGPDLDECEGLLAQWAWRIVQQWTTLAGLGDWGETFVQPTRPRLDQAPAIDHVAPKVTVDDEMRVTRRFVHRTVLEHFVAEHIAAVDVDEARDILLPHLWFDPAWRVAAPAAIAAHNYEQRGVLFQRLLDLARHPATDPARQAARREFDQLLLAIAQESDPEDWEIDHQHVLDDCRVRSATRDPAAITRSAHWTGSNDQARRALLAALPNADPWDAGRLAEALVGLEPTVEERAHAREGLLAALPNADPRVAGWLVEALVGLEPTVEERAHAREGLLAALPNADPQVADTLAATLRSLSTVQVWLAWLVSNGRCGIDDQ